MISLMLVRISFWTLHELWLIDWFASDRSEENIISFASNYKTDVKNPSWQPGPPTAWDEHLLWAENAILDMAILWEDRRPATIITGGGAFLIGVFFTMIWLPLVLGSPKASQTNPDASKSPQTKPKAKKTD